MSLPIRGRPARLSRALRTGSFCVALAASPARAEPPLADTILRGATVYDGTGGTESVADVALRGDRIAAIGDLGEWRAARDLDVRGLAVAPGFINMLSWAGESLIVDGRAQSDVRQGVTLEVLGEGTSMGPLSASMKADAVRAMDDFRYEIRWTSLGEYLDFLARRGVSTNVASFVGATTVRVHELGSADRRATPRELARMQDLVRAAMREGAMGVSSSLIYAPASFADTAELTALAKAAGESGGAYITHLRSEGDRLLEAIEEFLQIARATRRHAEVYHLKVGGKANWGRMDAAIAKLEAARRSGLDVSANMYVYAAGATGLDASTPPWSREGGTERWLARLRDPALRSRLLEDVRAEHPAWENLYRLAGSAENVRLIAFRTDSLKPLTGRTLAEVAAARGRSPEEVILDLPAEDGSRVGAAYFTMSEENVEKQLRLPWISLGSDEEAAAPEMPFLLHQPHPRAYGNFARFLGTYVRERRVASWADAIRRLTSLPARNLGIRDRGLLAPGYFADVVVFDPKKVQDRATYEKPHQYAEGIVHVFVNGRQVVREGEHTGEKPGRVVRGPGWRATPAPASR